MGVVVNLLLLPFYSLITGSFYALIFLPLLFLKVFLDLRKAKPVAHVERELQGKTIIITGANSGIGLATALHLAGRGARLILASRNVGSSHIAKNHIVRVTRNKNIDIYQLDLSSIWSIKNFVKKILENEERIDVLINNSGVGGLRRKVTPDGLELTWQINHLGPLMLTHLLLGKMKSTGHSRIIFMSSTAHQFHDDNFIDDMLGKTPDNPWKTFCNTKLANVLTMKYLSKKLEGTGITVNCANPGLVYTNIFSRLCYVTTFDSMVNLVKVKLIHLFLKYYGKSLDEGSVTPVALASEEKYEKVTGKYFAEKNESNCMARITQNDQVVEDFWKRSIDLLGLDATDLNL